MHATGAVMRFGHDLWWWSHASWVGLCPQKHTKCLDAHLNGLQPLTTNEAALVLGTRTKVM